MAAGKGLTRIFQSHRGDRDQGRVCNLFAHAEVNWGYEVLDWRRGVSRPVRGDCYEYISPLAALGRDDKKRDGGVEISFGIWYNLMVGLKPTLRFGL